MIRYNYRNFNDLFSTIQKNLDKVPKDIDLIVGVPRSGMIPAYAIGLFLNKKVCTLDEFLNNNIPSSGKRTLDDTSICKKILIVDDSINTGNANRILMKKLSAINLKEKVIKTLVVYATNISRKKVDYYFEIVDNPRIFEWNYLNHPDSAKWCYDIDGVLCVDPTDEENDDGEKYKEFLRNAKPLFIPKYTIYALVTSRLEKYRKETEYWLEKNAVRYEHLYMLNLANKFERQKLQAHGKYKAEIYNSLPETTLFIESSAKQAREISRLTGKPCMAVENNKLYNEKIAFDKQIIDVTPQKCLDVVKDIKISIIMPVYNVGEYLQQSLDTLRSQTLQEIEIICVDDGSTDDSYDILLKNSKEDVRIRILQQENQQAGLARNNGFALAKGKYVIFLDPDDFFKLDMLEKLYKKMEETNADICIFQATYFDNETGQLIYNPKELLRTEYLPIKKIFNYKDIPNDIFTITTGAPWNKILRTNFVKEKDLKFQDLKNTNDAYFTFIALVKANAITTLDENLLYYRRNVNSSLQSNKKISPLEFVKAFTEIKNTLVKIGIYNDVKKSYSIRAMMSSIYNLESTKGYDAFEHIYYLLKNELITVYDLKNKDISYFPNFAKNVYMKIQLIEKDDPKKYWNSYIKSLKQENIKENKIEDMISYRIGRCITFLPRLVWEVFGCLKTRGVSYTFTKIKEKFGLLYINLEKTIYFFKEYGFINTLEKIKEYILIRL